jgi:hypothetical protein
LLKRPLPNFIFSHEGRYFKSSGDAYGSPARSTAKWSLHVSSYVKLGVILAVNLLLMFLLTYALIASGEHFIPNLNRVYMATLMAAPMSVVMLLFMPSMFPDKKLNNGILIAAIAVFLAVFFMTRTQAFIGNEGLLKAMIPHHSSAILMCRDAKLTDPDVRRLCTGIIESQQREIAEMKALLEREGDRPEPQPAQ